MQLASLRLGSVLTAVGLVALALVTSSAQQNPQESAATPPLPTAPGPSAIPFDVLGPSQLADGTISAVIVRSWSAGGASAWGELNTEWPMYGPVPIAIDIQTLAGASSFTYAQLAATAADVVILSNPAGGVEQFSREEVEAIRRYTREGHDIIGTFLTFFNAGVNNTELASIFGLRRDVQYVETALPVSNHFQSLTDSTLFGGMTEWQSLGYPFTETMTNFPRWNSIGLAGAKLVAQCDRYIGMVSVYQTPDYRAVFFSNMPEYFGGTVDKQILYNAITGL